MNLSLPAVTSFWAELEKIAESGDTLSKKRKKKRWLVPAGVVLGGAVGGGAGKHLVQRVKSPGMAAAGEWGVGGLGGILGGTVASRAAHERVVTEHQPRKRK